MLVSLVLLLWLSAETQQKRDDHHGYLGISVSRLLPGRYRLLAASSQSVPMSV